MLRLSPEAQSTIKDIVRHAAETGIVGLDADDLVVLWVRDQRRTRMTAIHRNGRGLDVNEPVRWFTDAEVQEMDPWDAELLFSLPIKPPTQEVRHDT